MFLFPPRSGLFSPPPPMAPMFGKTQYKYITPDGGPPLDGKVPSGSPFDPPNPLAPSSPFATGPPCPWSPPPAANQWYQFSSVGPPPPYGGSPAPPVVRAQGFSAPPPPPPPAPRPAQPGREFYSSQDTEEPVQGNRVKGQIAKFDNGAGYIFPKNNCTLHVFSENVVSKYSAQGNMIKIGNDKFKVQHAPCDMTFEELIEGLDCRRRANHHPPYNRPGHGYPDDLIGIQELLDCGGGWFEIGTKITLGSCQARSKIGDIWPATVGTAGQFRPRHIVRCPV